jgi:Zn-dependent peptidase ImmA (M78 family)
MVALAQERIREIANLAEGYADTFFPESWIDPGLLLAKLGIRVSYNYYGDAFDGLLEWKHPSFHIYCNLDQVESSTSARARFTLGHELGHLLIDEHRRAMMSGKAPFQHPSFAEALEPKSRVEAEADVFASNLLMPAGRLEKVIPATGDTRTFQQIQQLQNTFNVSFQSAALKAVDTARYAFCAFVMWRADKPPWYRVSRGFQQSGYVHIKINQELPWDCATSLCLREESTPGDFAPRTNATTAATWFFRVYPGSKNDIPLTETAVRLGNRGVFTLLSWEAPQS